MLYFSVHNMASFSLPSCYTLRSLSLKPKLCPTNHKRADHLTCLCSDKTLSRPVWLKLSLSVNCLGAQSKMSAWFCVIFLDFYSEESFPFLYSKTYGSRIQNVSSTKALLQQHIHLSHINEWSFLSKQASNYMFYKLFLNFCPKYTICHFFQ